MVRPLHIYLQVAGHVVLVDRGNCTFTAKANIAEDAGAIALLVANNREGTFLYNIIYIAGAILKEKPVLPSQQFNR